MKLLADQAPTYRGSCFTRQFRVTAGACRVNLLTLLHHCLACFGNDEK